MIIDKVPEIIQLAYQRERERIIALLKDNMCNAYGEDCADNPECGAYLTIIAIIKGENE